MAVKQRALGAQDKEERRGEILDAAEKLFLRHPDRMASVAEVAEAAGLAKGTVYLYFPGKEEMLLALHERHVTHFFAEDKLTYASVGGKAHCVDYSIAELEQRLDPRQFLRIHRATLVNLAHVKEVAPLPGGGLNLRLKDDSQTDLTVSRDRARVLKAGLGY